MRILSRVMFVIFITFCIVISITAFGRSKDPKPEISTTISETMVAHISIVSTAPPEEPVNEIWPYSITQEEIDLIALITMAEAEGETELGQRLVIDTVLNRMDDPHFPDTVHDVIYYPNAFSPVWNGRLERCHVMPELVELVKEELLNRTNYDCVFFCSSGYSKYGEPMFQECCHYFSSYD